MFIKLKVHPSAKRAVLRKKEAGSYEVWIKEPAERGLANAAALRVLANELRVDAKRLMLIKGAQSPSKIIKLV